MAIGRDRHPPLDLGAGRNGAAHARSPRTVLGHFDGSPANAVIWADAANPGDYARLAPVVFDHAERRDPLAMSILHEAALEVERHVTRLLDHGAPAVAMIGGVFPKILPWLAPPLRPHLVPVVEGESDAMEGAILMAQRALAALGEGLSRARPCLQTTAAARGLDESNPTPLYLQLQRVIQDAVRAGKLKADEALPSERDLARQLGISRVTVRKAIAGLVEKGILVQRWGSGTFIAPDDACRAGALAAVELHRRHDHARPEAGRRGSRPVERPGFAEGIDGARPFAGRAGQPAAAPPPCRRHPDGDRARGGAGALSCPTRTSSRARSTPC